MFHGISTPNDIFNTEILVFVDVPVHFLKIAAFYLDCLVSFFKCISTFLEAFGARYLFPKGISPKVNVTTCLLFDFTFYPTWIGLI